MAVIYDRYWFINDKHNRVFKIIYLYSNQIDGVEMNREVNLKGLSGERIEVGGKGKRHITYINYCAQWSEGFIELNKLSRWSVGGHRKII